MGATILLQKLQTLRGAASTTWVQPASEAADLLHFKDFTVFIELSDFNNVSFALQTSPTHDEKLFVDFGAGIPLDSAGVGALTFRYASLSGLPVARFVRWRAYPTSAGAWSATLRIWLACNWSGNARKQRPDHKQALDDHLKMHADNAKRAEDAAASGD